jgi:DNA-binding winged helix-turn-helix (wHTH) protein
MMDALPLLLPYLKITSPEGAMEYFELTKTLYTIGRLPEYNDITLPEEEGVITRIEHCVLEKRAGGWTITDKSTNGTILEREGQKWPLGEQKERQALISSEDIIIIHHWRLQFIDPNQTKALNPPKSQNIEGKDWVFNIAQQALVKQENGVRTSIRLRRQVRQMLAYMATKNLANNNTPVLCRKDDLSVEIWEDKEHKMELDKLAKEIRDIFGQQQGGEQWLETVVGAGYILRIDVEA